MQRALHSRCFVGKRHLEEAMQAFSGDIKFEVTWKPFFLNRNTPEAGVPLMEYLEKKYGPQAKKMALEGSSPLTEAGRAVGINFNSNRYIVNTLRSHCLLDYAKTVNKQDAVAEKLFAAYFEDAQNINSEEILSSLAAGLGLDQAMAMSHMKEPVVLARVNEEAAEALDHGVNGVPYFDIHLKGDNRNVASFSGAQPPDTFKQVFRRQLAKTKSNV